MLDEILKQIGNSVLGYGPAGMIILVEAWLIYQLDKRLQAADTKLETLRGKYVEDVSTLIRALSDSTRATSEVTEATEANNQVLQRVVLTMEANTNRVLDNLAARPRR